MIDRDDGYLVFYEMKEVFQALSQWRHDFYILDQDRSNSLDVEEFKNGKWYKWPYSYRKTSYISRTLVGN